MKKKPQGEASTVKKRIKPYPVVAIGGSAGGMEALEELLSHLSPSTGMAFIYIQHLDPLYKSKLTDILSRSTEMKVVEAQSDMRIQPDHLYVIPPNKEMFIQDELLKLSPRPQNPQIHMPINEFFLSLAESQREGSIGIVLSGNANDGALGLKAISAAGGLVFAQDKTARFQSMPASAIAEGIVDMVLSPSQMAAELERLSSQSHALNAMMDSPDENFENVKDIDNILPLLKKSSGVDFTHYKPSTISRRIIRRMLLCKQETLKAYTRYLEQNPSELDQLYQDLLINVTSFFRDADMIEYYTRTLLPKIIRNKNSKEPLRVWVPACSTGEEAYSIAILLMEAAGREKNMLIQIFATDLSETAIAKARVGIYSKIELASMPPKLLERYFTPVDGSFRVNRSIRDICIFAPHNVFGAPPFSRLDLISCCNLLIYLDHVLQKKIFSIFHYALNPNGYLVLGKSETVGTSINLFSVADKKVKVYQKKKNTNARPLFEVNYKVPPSENSSVGKMQKTGPKEPRYWNDIEKTVDNVILNRYVPPSVVVSADLEIVHFRGATSLFLEPAQGKASFNLLKMARPGLGFELRSLVRKAAKTGESIKKSGVEITRDGKLLHVSIEVVPLVFSEEESYFLVLFEEIHNAPVSSSAAVMRDKRIRQLELELINAREDMRSMIEEQEAVNEELQSANEEIVSSNEELQSINEELETAKEEVESSNEELMTINSEIQLQHERLSESYEYAEAVIETISEAVIVLDQDLRVRTVNRAFCLMFGLKENELERHHIFDLDRGEWNIPQLREHLDSLHQHGSGESEFQLRHSFRNAGEMVLQIKSRIIQRKSGKQQLILIAIQNITSHITAQRMISENAQWLRNIADNAPVLMWTARKDGSRDFFNKTWLEFTGRTEKMENENGWKDIVHPDDIKDVLKIEKQSILKVLPYHAEFRMKKADGSFRWMLATVKPYHDLNGELLGFIGTAADIDDKKMSTGMLESRVDERTRSLTDVNKRLEASNDELRQFAYVASHDLKEPLRKILTYSGRLKKEKDKGSENSMLFVEKMSESASRMWKLIDELLNFSRSTRNTTSFEPVDIKSTLKDVMKDLDMQVKQNKVKITVQKLPQIDAIPVQIFQLFYNLMTNAIKFSKGVGKPEIHVSATRMPKAEIPASLPAERAYYHFIIRDNGIGFDQKQADKAFVIFQRLHDTQDYPGTGIGLALCKKIVANHEGDIYAESKPGKGATFHIILPEKQEAKKS